MAPHCVQRQDHCTHRNDILCPDETFLHENTLENISDPLCWYIVLNFEQGYCPLPRPPPPNCGEPIFFSRHYGGYRYKMVRMRKPDLPHPDGASFSVLCSGLPHWLSVSYCVDYSDLSGARAYVGRCSLPTATNGYGTNQPCSRRFVWRRGVTAEQLSIYAGPGCSSKTITCEIRLVLEEKYSCSHRVCFAGMRLHNNSADVNYTGTGGERLNLY